VKTSSKERPWSFGQRIALAILPPVAALLLRAIASTLRYEFICEPGLVVPPPPATGIYCIWHRAILLAACHFQRYHAVVLISQSFDGELVTRTAQRMGYGAARGSSSKGALEGLMGMKQAVEGGHAAIFTADGPRGPIYRTKMGPIKLAQMTGYPAFSFYLLPERVWEAKSWDRLMIPKPFSRVIVSFAHGVPVDADADGTELESRRQELQQALERARLNAEAHLAMRQRSRAVRG
jgi:lysophospholipid acyltransferase (LPLAT)-like uncharacterized protein